MNAEQEYAQIVVEWLSAGGWQVYQEVVTPCGRCDIVAVKGALRWAIEVKTSMNLDVLDQARRNMAYFHHSSVAVPAPKDNLFTMPRSWELAHDYAKRIGFGVIRILPSLPNAPKYSSRQEAVVKQDIPPSLRRRVGTVNLHEEQKTWCAAGSSSGGHYTRFQRTVRDLVAYTRRNPGTLLKDALQKTDHHYASIASATGAISKLIRCGVIEELRLDNGKLYPLSADTPLPAPLFDTRFEGSLPI